MDNLWILAQTEADEVSTITSGPPKSEDTATGTVASDPNTTPTSQRPPGGLGGQWIFYILIALMIYFIFLSFFGPRKKQQQHQRMVKSLKKNDKVRTIGGIIGTIVDIKDDEVTLKVDESTNTKIKITSSAIGKNVSTDK